MSEKVKKTMLAASQTRQHTDGNYFEVLTLQTENEIIGFCSFYSKETGFVCIGLDIREPYCRREYGTPRRAQQLQCAHERYLITGTIDL